jgi:hypothetical protein
MINPFNKNIQVSNPALHSKIKCPPKNGKEKRVLQRLGTLFILTKNDFMII